MSLLAAKLNPLYGPEQGRLYVACSELGDQLKRYWSKVPATPRQTHPIARSLSSFSDVRSLTRFYRETDCLWDTSLTYWDELYIRAFYAKHFYWEADLLLAYRKVRNITKMPLDKTAYKAMRDPEKRPIEKPFRDCRLVLSENKIEENYDPDLIQFIEGAASMENI